MATITGTNASETLTGTGGDDHIEGLAGNDNLNGGGGADTIIGGDDADTIHGESGDDLLYGGAGSDYLNGGLGNDDVEGGEGDDSFESQDGSDTLDGGGGNDRFWITRQAVTELIAITGGAGNDRLEASIYGPSTITFDGGEGDDEVYLSSPRGTYLLTFGSGIDTLAISGQPEVTASITITDFVTGPGGDRTDFSNMLGSALTNWDHNRNPFASGHLRLIQSGTDALLQLDRDGGANGFVTIITFNNASAAAFSAENLDGFPQDGSIPAGLALSGTSGNDEIVGAAGDDAIDGLAGADMLWGGSGDDVLNGGSERDELYGEGGADTLDGGSGDDRLDPGYGDDLVRGGNGDDYIESWGAGSPLLQGDADNDLIYINRSNGGTADTVTAEGGSGNDTFLLVAYGPSHRFLLDGGIGADTVRIGWLQGVADVTLGAGSDIVSLEDTQLVLALYGSIFIRDFQTGAGGDMLDLDTFLFSNLVGWDQGANPFGAGYLRLVQAGADSLLQIDLDRSGSAFAFRTIITFNGVNASSFVQANLDGYPPDGSQPAGVTLIGSAAGETLTGTSGNDRIEGRGGYDTIRGEGGADTLIGGSDYDDIRGGASNDTIDGGDGGGILDGETGDDLVRGGAGVEFISLGDGADVVHAGAGDDSIFFYANGAANKSSVAYGEAGNDVFSIRSYSLRSWVADGGGGSDLFEIGAVTGTTTLTLGMGSDRIKISGDRFVFGPGTLLVTDFQSGAGGDLLDLPASLGELLSNWSSGDNPVRTGHIRLVQSGADTTVQIDGNGGNDSFVDLITLQGVDAGTLTLANLGYAPRIEGAAGADLLAGGIADDTLLGFGGDDSLTGNGGNDRLDGGSGADTMRGGTGNDRYVVDTDGDLVIEAAAEGIDTVETALGVGRFLQQKRAAAYVLTGEVENFTGSYAATDLAIGQGVRGNALDNAITGSNGADYVDLRDGGSDTVDAGEGRDVLFYGDALTAADRNQGGSQAGDARGDLLVLQGASYGGFTLGAETIDGIEQLRVIGAANDQFGGAAAASYDYRLYTIDANVEAGERLVVNGQSLSASESLEFDGSAESDGRFQIFGGAGDDILRGGARDDHLLGREGQDVLTGNGGADLLRGGLAQDRLEGGAGADTYAYASGRAGKSASNPDGTAYAAVMESTGIDHDILVGFDFAEDKINLPGTVSGWAATVTSGHLDLASFDTDLAAAVNAPLGPNQALLFTPTIGSLANSTFLVVDDDGDGAYQAGVDYVFELQAAVGTIPPTPDIFI